MKSTLFAVLLVLAASSAPAAEFCVTNSQQLDDALWSARNNGQNDVIRIATGSYVGGFAYGGSEDFDLTLSGGWSEFFGNPCGQQIDSPYATILDGNLTERVMLIQAALDSDITVSDLTFINGDANPASAGGLEIRSLENFVGDVLVERTAFINNKGHFYSALSSGRGRKVTVRNSVFALNENTTGDGTLFLGNNDALGIYFNNNTVVNNSSLATDPSVHSGLRAYPFGTSGLFVANNLFWDNDGRDFSVGGSASESYLYNNNIADYFGSMDVVANNFSMPPVFEPGIFNYVPAINSGEINHGRNSPIFVPVPPPFNVQWGAGITDFYGNPRVIDRWVDVGAFEAEAEVPIFDNGFEIILF